MCKKGKVVWLMFHNRHMEVFKIDARSVNWQHHWCIKAETIRKWADNEERFQDWRNVKVHQLAAGTNKIHFPCGCRLWVRSLRAAARAASGQMKLQTSMLCFGKTAWLLSITSYDIILYQINEIMLYHIIISYYHSTLDHTILYHMRKNMRSLVSFILQDFQILQMLNVWSFIKASASK